MYKIAIIGPESTGKTILARELADHFKSEWIPEYARNYVEKLASPYNYNDVCKIALEQIRIETSYNNNGSKNELVFFDTELIITKVWFEYKYKKIPDFLKNYMTSNSCDFYLLCKPDIEWQPDAVREHGHDRDFFFNWYKKEIESKGKPYYIVSGTGKSRTQNAINAINNNIKLR